MRVATTTPDIPDIIDRQLCEHLTPDYERSMRGVAHVSTAGQCGRRIWMLSQLDAAPPPRDVETDLIFRWGDTAHARVQEAIVALGGKVEVPVQRGRVIGSADGVLGGDVIEIKTIKNLYYVTRSAKREHMLQAGIYALLLGAPRFHILYVSRLDACRIWHTYGVTGEAGRELARLDGIVQEVGAPEGEPSWLCQFCEFRADCPVAPPMKRLEGNGGAA